MNRNNQKHKKIIQNDQVIKDDQRRESDRD